MKRLEKSGLLGLCLVVVLISFVPFILVAQEAPLVEWDTTFGGEDYDYASFVQQTSDGGYIVSGGTYSFGTGSGRDAWLIKTNDQGEKEWARTFGDSADSAHEYANCVRQTSDGGYVVAGYTEFFSSNGRDAWLIKTNDQGEEQWKLTFDSLDFECFNSVQQTSDEGYIIAGEIRFGSYTGRSDFWLVKIDSTGNVQWNLTFGGPDGECASSVQQTSDGGYIIAGTIYSYSVPGGADAYVIKIDSVGNVQWTRIFGTPYFDYVSFMQKTSDGGYILTGSVYCHGSTGDENVWLAKLDSTGKEYWNHTFGSPDDDECGYSVQQTFDGGYIVAGYTYSGGKDALLIKTNAQGEEQWKLTFGGSDCDWASSVQQTFDSGYIIAGITYSFGAGESDAWLIKLEGENHGAVDEEFGIPESFVLSQNYPNPFNHQTNISFDLPKNAYITLTVFNALGQKVETLIDEERRVGTYQVTWNAANFPNGVYLYRLEAEDFNTTKKMLLMK